MKVAAILLACAIMHIFTVVYTHIYVNIYLYNQPFAIIVFLLYEVVAKNGRMQLLKALSGLAAEFALIGIQICKSAQRSTSFGIGERSSKLVRICLFAVEIVAH